MKIITKFGILLLLVIFSVVYLLLPYPSASLGGSSPDDVDSYITSKMSELGIPGMGLGIIRGDAVYLKGYGKADSTGRPLTPSTPFLLGSTTKSITAVAVMQLVQQKKIDLDEKVTAYLPGFRFKEIEQSNKITVRQLLNQTSGIKGATGNSDYLNETSTAGDFVAALADVALSAAPGETYQYAEANFVILGEIVSAVSGQSYEAYIQEHIFKPLNMLHSYTNKKAAEIDGVAAGNITWFGLPVETHLPYPVQYTAASALISSAEDLTHYVSLYLQNGKYGSATLLTPESLNAIAAPDVSLLHPAGYSYGMGWFVKGNLLMHDGRPTNYYSILLIDREQRVGIVLLANANNRLITAEYLMPMAYEMMNTLTGEPKLPEGFGFQQLYRMINIFSLWVAALLILRIVITLTSWRRKMAGANSKPRTYVKNLWVDFVLLASVACLMFYLLLSYEVSVQIAYLGQPDIVLSLLIFMLLPMINAASRIALMVKHQKAAVTIQ